VKLETLFEAPGLPAYDLPLGLRERYGGPLGFASPRLYANFVSSIDGVVALGATPASPSVISGRSEADRFVMGLLRACAQVVLIGAGTLRAEPDHLWTPEHIYPEAADDYALLRRQLGLVSQPLLVVITASGEVDTDVPALELGALIVTTDRGAEVLGRSPASEAAILRVGSGGALELGGVVEDLRMRGHGVILTEGGPKVVGQLARERLLDELFLTISPMLAGRTSSEDRPGVVDGVDLVSPPHWGELVSLRRHRSHLFARYRLERSR
jgi:riboflavin biosynthesis pyrimidine reductase